MKAIHDNPDSVPFNCYFSGTIGELIEFINNGIYFKDEYEHEEV